MQQISVTILFGLTVASVAAHMRLDVTTAAPKETGKIEDIMNVVIIEAKTTEEKEILMSNVKSMIENITEIAKGAVAVLQTNKELLNKVVTTIDDANEMLDDKDDFGAMELMQTILISKIQEIMKEDGESVLLYGKTDPPRESVSPFYSAKMTKK